MKKKKQKLLLRRRDYDLLLRYVYSRMTPVSSEQKNAEQLYEELKSAKVYEDNESLPGDVIALNSDVEVEEKQSGRIMKFSIVLPTQANMSKQRLSLFAPLAIALMGYRKGQEITWDMPSGQKKFHVKEVSNAEVGQMQ